MSFLQYLKDKSETVLPLNEGGAAGHCSHIFDDRSMTFKELKTMLLDIFSGNVEMTEKVDGANITVTWKDGEIGFARNTKTIKEPMNLAASKAWVNEMNPEVRQAMFEAVKSLNSAFKKLPEATLQKWFNNGKKFMSAEVITPKNKNTIDYGEVYLIMPHNITEYDDKGKKVSENPSAAKEIYNTLKDMDALESEGFTISGPRVMSIKDTLKAQSVLEETIKEIDKFCKKFKLSDSNTIQDYINSFWTTYIKNLFPKINKELNTILINRWAKQDKSVNSREIKKLLGNDSDIDKFNEIEKQSGELYTIMFSPLEIICLKAAAQFLKTLEGFIAANPNETISKLTNEVSAVVDKVLKNPEQYSVALGNQIEKLKKIGLDNIAPEEGVVFAYKNKIFKLTGAFAPLNRILNEFKFGKA